jgi:adenosine deaminase
MEDHPVRTLVEAGAFVTLNTDDPAMFDCTLAGEYALVEALGFDDDTMRMLAESAVDASWASPARKRDLHRGLAAWWQRCSSPPVA